MSNPAGVRAASSAIIPPIVLEAPSAEAADVSSFWGLSTLSSCCTSLDECSGNYLSAIASAVVNFISSCWEKLVELYEDLTQGPEGESQEIPLQDLDLNPGQAVGHIPRQITAEEFLQKWDGVDVRVDEWLADLRALPHDLLLQTIANFTMSVMQSEKALELVENMFKTAPQEPAILNTIKNYRPIINLEAAVQEAEEVDEEELTVEEFVKKWGRITNKPPGEPAKNAKQKEKDQYNKLCINYEKLCVDWFNNVTDISRLSPTKIAMPIKAIHLAANSGQDTRTWLKNNLANPAIIQIIKNYQPEQEPAENIYG